jgi:RNA ligase
MNAEIAITLPQHDKARLYEKDHHEFVPFQKICRLSRECVITEKIDGTNAQILITDDGQILAGSRTRWITPAEDNHGFARWVMENKDELLKLGPGRHFGEWWGSGIQRGYGLKEKRFSLFNTAKWSDPTVRPACCHVTPVIAAGMFTTELTEKAIEMLRIKGSFAASGFTRPEGIVVFHVAGNLLFKKTLEKDEVPKTNH